MNQGVKNTLLAKVYDVAIESPLKFAPILSAQSGCRVLLKREDLQSVHSFKLRGAYNKIVHLSDKQKKKGIIAASAGNHAQGVALSAHKLGLSALIVMPRTTPGIKIEAVRTYGAEIVLAGDNYSEAYDHCQEKIKQTGRTFIHPFDDPLVMAGQGTVGREILDQSSGVTHIFIPVGGGGLLAGIAQYVKSLRPDVQIIGVEPTDSAAMQASLAAGKRVKLSHVGVFADGAAVKQVGMNTFNVARQHVDKVISVDNDQICAAIKSIFEDTRTIVEPAGALAVAGVQLMASQKQFRPDSVITAICSGANMSFERLQFIAERTLLGSGKEALFAVQLHEQPGTLKQFCEHVVKGVAITEFSYRLNDRLQAHIFVGIGLNNKADKQSFIKRLKRYKYSYQDLSFDNLAKEHVRHMIGGAGKKTRDERLYVIEFPERPRALNDFLQKLGKRWNISLFHYRGQGGDQGNVLIGFEAGDFIDLEQNLQQAGYEYRAVDSKAFNIFL